MVAESIDADADVDIEGTGGESGIQEGKSLMCFNKPAESIHDWTAFFYV